MNTRLLRLAALSSACAFSTPSMAQDILEIVTVTAQKREQNLQDVGISVSALSGEALRATSVTSTIDAVMKIPSVDNYSPYGPGSSANIVIRGVGLNDFGEGHEAPVTAYVDEFYVVAVPAVDFSMFDLARVEVLRGPQGTLFGRNSTGGLIHFVTAKPSQTADGFVQLTAADFGEYKVEGAFGGALTNSLSGRVSVLSHHSDGFEENVTPGFKRAGQAGTDAIRAQLLWEGQNDLSVLFKAEYGETDVRHIYYQQVPAQVDPTNGGLFVRNPAGSDGAGYNQLTFNNGIARSKEIAQTNTPSTLDSTGKTALLRVEKGFGSVSFTSLTGYMTHDRDLSEDCDASPNDICSAVFPYSSDTLTQELRWNGTTDRMRWTAGLYYMDLSATNEPSAVFNVPVGGPGAVSPTTGLYVGPVFPLALAADWELDTESYSAFAQTEFDFASTFTFIAGARYTHDEKDFLERDNASLRNCSGFPIPTNCAADYVAQPYSADYSKNLVSGKLELDWRPVDGVLVYGSVSRGTKAGGFNNGFYPAGIQPAQIPYGDENVIALEVGTKLTLADGRTRLNVSAFQYDYNDFQVFNWEGIGGLLGNRDAKSLGAEAEIETLLGNGFSATVGLGVLDTEIKDVRLRDGVTIRDTEMSMAPDFTASGTLRYSIDLSGGRMLNAQWDCNYATERYTNNFNDPAARLESYFKHNARLALDLNNQWTLAAFVNNISDNQHTQKIFVFDSLGYAQDIYAMPRTYGAMVTYQW